MRTDANFAQIREVSRFHQHATQAQILCGPAPKIILRRF